MLEENGEKKMTIKQALETFNGAEIMSTNVPIRKLQAALVALVSAAKRCMKFDKQFFDGDLVEVGNCEGCIYSHRKRPQKCSCCRRNRDLKDCYERREENAAD